MSETHTWPRWTLTGAVTLRGSHLRKLAGPRLNARHPVDVMTLDEHHAQMRRRSQVDHATAQQLHAELVRVRAAAQAVLDTPMEDHADSVPYFAALDRLRDALTQPSAADTPSAAAVRPS